MKNQALFSLRDEGKKLKCRLLQFLFGTLRVKLCQATLSTKCQSFNSRDWPPRPSG